MTTSPPGPRLLLKGYPELGPLAQAYGHAEVGDHLEIHEEGIPFALALDVNSGSVTGLDVTVGGRAFPDVKLTSETSFDRWTKAIALDVEPQVGDPAFDPLVYVSTTLDEPAVRVLLASPTAREAVAWLLASEVSVIQLGGAGIRVTLRTAAFDPAVFRRYVRPLLALARSLGPVPAGARGRRGYGAPVAILVTAIAWAVLGQVLLLHGVTSSQALETTPYWLGFLVQVPLFAVFAGVAWFGARGRPRSSLYVFISLAVFGLGGVGHAFDLLWLNAALDRSPAVERRFRVLDASHDEDSTLLTIESVKAPKVRGSVRFQRSLGRVDEHVTLRTHAGALGWEWTTASP